MTCCKCGSVDVAVKLQWYMSKGEQVAPFCRACARETAKQLSASGLAYTTHSIGEPSHDAH